MAATMIEYDGVIRDASPGDLAEIDRRMAELSERLGVPVGPR